MPETTVATNISYNGGDFLKKGKISKVEASTHPTITWNKKVQNTGVKQFQEIIEDKYNLRFKSYWDFHKWTVENYVTFWEEVWDFVDVVASKPYDKIQVKTGPGFLDYDWFSGALFNYAENILRHRDDSIALTCLDEYGNEDTVTFAEMFEEVKLYAAAFRKNGLKKGNTVACFMSNRKEAVFAMLAVTSIGAIWGGTLPYYGARAASNVVSMMEPKFLITIDSHQDEGREMKLIDYLPFIADNAPTLEKVILLATKEETLQRDLFDIRNCVLLEEFLQDGRTPDGNVPDIVFEQLPPSHPVAINFTSGTTGLPKGPVHSVGTLLPQLRDFKIHLNMNKGDVMANIYPVGWSMWDFAIPCLTLGCQLFLYCGSFYQKVNGMNFWDIVAKYKVKFFFLVTSVADKMEKMGMVPSPDSDMDSLKMVGIGGSPAKKENFEYIRTSVKQDVFVASEFGATESFGEYSGFDLNTPVHGGEIQAPALGMEIQCFDDEGEPVVGKRGEFVICTPCPSFPVYLWKDENNEKLTQTYLQKFPGVWCQNDECWVNPKTHGIVVFGRSDDTLKQKGERFGSGDIYFAIHSMEELQDYICVGQQKYNGDSRAILFVKLKQGLEFTPELKAKIEAVIEEELWEDCVPELILPIAEIPYNLNNKRLESVLRMIVKTNQIPDVLNIKNPESLKHYVNIPEITGYNQK